MDIPGGWDDGVDDGVGVFVLGFRGLPLEGKRVEGAVVVVWLEGGGGIVMVSVAASLGAGRMGRPLP